MAAELSIAAKREQSIHAADDTATWATIVRQRASAFQKSLKAYGLQPESASKLIVALDQAMKAQDDQSATAAWASIGVDLQEARSIGTAGSLSAATIDRMAQALDQDVKDTELMTNRILSIAREQQAARQGNTNM